MPNCFESAASHLHRFRSRRRQGVISTTTRRLALAYMVDAATALAQAPSLQDLQNKLLQYEESSQKAIAELKAQIATLQQAQKPPGALPASPVAPQTSEVP